MFSEEKRILVSRYVAQGYNYVEIQKKTGVPARTIARWVKTGTLAMPDPEREDIVSIAGRPREKKEEKILELEMKPIEKPIETKPKENPKTLELDTCGACGAEIPEGRPKNCPGCGGEFVWQS